MLHRMLLAGSRCLLVASFALASAGCHRPPDTEQVRAAIHAAARAAEAGEGRATVEPLTEDFAGNHGELDATGIRQMVALARLRHERLGVTLGPISVERRGERLVANFTASFTRGQGVVPERLGVFDIQSAWRKDGGAWRCYAATWEEKL